MALHLTSRMRSSLFRKGQAQGIQSTTTTARSFHKTTKSKKSAFTAKAETSFNPIEWYAAKLETHPLLTKAITSGVIAASGDMTCQYLIYTKQQEQRGHIGGHVEDEFAFQPDLMRTSRFGFLGFALIAPVIHNFYAVVNARFPGRSLKAVLQRTLVDQLLFAPLFIPTFMTSLMILEGKGTGQHEDFTVITDTLKQKVPDVVVTNWMVWMPAIFLNFRYVPVQWQVLYSNCVGFGWNTYLSWKTQENDKN